MTVLMTSEAIKSHSVFQECFLNNLSLLHPWYWLQLPLLCPMTLERSPILSTCPERSAWRQQCPVMVGMVSDCWNNISGCNEPTEHFLIRVNCKNSSGQQTSFGQTRGTFPWFLALIGAQVCPQFYHQQWGPAPHSSLSTDRVGREQKVLSVNLFKVPKVRYLCPFCSLKCPQMPRNVSRTWWTVSIYPIILYIIYILITKCIY